MAVGIVYSAATGRLRSIVMPDTDAQLDTWLLHAGEAMLILSDAQFAPLSDVATVQAYITTQTGLTPSGDRAVTVDADGFVKRVDIVDEAAGDTAFPGTSLIHHHRAVPGWVVFGGQFLAIPDFAPKGRARTIRSYKNRGRRLAT